jgi:hypothetical protein
LLRVAWRGVGREGMKLREVLESEEATTNEGGGEGVYIVLTPKLSVSQSSSPASDHLAIGSE